MSLEQESCRVEGIKCEFLGFFEGRSFCGYNGRPLSVMEDCPTGMGPIWRPAVFGRMNLKQVIHIIGENK